MGSLRRSTFLATKNLPPFPMRPKTPCLLVLLRPPQNFCQHHTVNVDGIETGNRERAKRPALAVGSPALHVRSSSPAESQQARVIFGTASRAGSASCESRMSG